MAGWKQWAYLEKVSSADFQSYLQNQVVPQFVSTTQRDSQYLTPPIGALCVTTDTLTLWQWNGTVWNAVSYTRAFCRLRPNATQSIPSQAVTLVTGMVADVNKGGGVWAGNTYTVPRDGHYRVSLSFMFSLSFVMNAGNPTMWSYVFVNGAGTTSINATQQAHVAGQIVNGTNQSTPLCRILPLQQGNTLDFRVQQTWTAAMNIIAPGSWVDIEELGIPL